jgi:hypothetical protein
MSRPPSFPATYDSALVLNISTLVQAGRLDCSLCTGVITWSSRGEQTGRIGYTIKRPFRDSTDAEIRLHYQTSGEERDYTIYLQALTSNLGAGLVWYFICPVTNKRCRKLYAVGSGAYFLHRSAYRGVYYDSQIRSKYARYLDSSLGAYFKSDKAYDEIYSKGFTKYYRGKPTKRYRKLLRIINQASSVDPAELQALIIKR